MKKEIILIYIFVITMIVLLQLVLAARAGEFSNADFSAPDYANGATETFDVGESRTFNYQCACGDVPGNSVCSGSIVLEVDAGSGFVTEKSSACNVGENQACSATYTKVFNIPGAYAFRVFCDENAGTDYIQPSSEHVTINVVDAGCAEGDIRSCPLQAGVCEGSYEICLGGAWPGCDYSSVPGYENPEATCDELDNDCNGLVDDVDLDNDGSSLCGGTVVNELLLAGVNNDYGTIEIMSYNQLTSSYETVWSTSTSGVSRLNGGGEIGDVTHDGVNDFLIARDSSDGYTRAEVWTYDTQTGEWYMVWRGGNTGIYGGIGDIGDFDNDGFTEFVISSSSGDRVMVFGNDVYNADTFYEEATLFIDDNCNFLTAAGDMNNNGIPEIVTQCAGEDLKIWEWSGSAYVNTVNVPMVPQRPGGSNTPVMDDIECGDVDWDGVDECVLCGNSGTSAVLDCFGGLNCTFTYIAPVTPTDASFTQTCTIADVTNDGFNDWFDASRDGIRVFSYDGFGYYNVWNSGSIWDTNPGIGVSFAGDADNDGFTEFFVNSGGPTPYGISSWENDVVGATSFSNTFTWSPTVYHTNIIVGNLNPSNDYSGSDCDDNNENRYPGATEICGNGVDEDCDGSDLACNCVDGDGDTYDGYDASLCPIGDDCNDNDYFVNPGVAEVCGDGIDNNCNGEIDEGCGPVCGDGYCDGRALGEDCRSCPADCWAGERGACCGDGKCDSNKGESALVCPVDCS